MSTSSPGPSKGVSDPNDPFFQVLVQQVIDGTGWSAQTIQEQQARIKGQALRNYADYQDLVHNMLKDLPIGSVQDAHCLGARLRDYSVRHSVDPSELSTGVQRVFTKLHELEEEPEIYVKGDLIQPFKQFISRTVNEYGQELGSIQEGTAQAAVILKQGAIAEAKQKKLDERETNPEAKQAHEERLQKEQELRRLHEPNVMSETEMLRQRQAQWQAEGVVPTLFSHEAVIQAQGLLRALALTEELSDHQREYIEELSDHPEESWPIIVELLNRYFSLRRDGYTLTGVWNSPHIQGQSVYFGIEPTIFDLLRVAETARDRGHGPLQIDISDWLMASARANVSVSMIPNRDLKEEAVVFIQADGLAELQLPDNMELRQLLERYPRVNGLSVKDVRELASMNREEREWLLNACNNLGDAGYSLYDLRISQPTDYSGDITLQRLIAVGTVARDMGHTALHIDDRDWNLAGTWSQDEIVERIGLEARPTLPGIALRYVRELKDIGPVRGRALLDRYDRLQADGYNLTILRGSIPEGVEAEYCNLIDLIEVGEMARERGHGPGQIDASDWKAAANNPSSSFEYLLKEQVQRLEG